ncbi:O-antigen ligase family protein [Pengzhenrongella sp.]|jgi:O-antigen ligase|uniref:O-antigen ligase family protein n=1 Tax=Pengzhenrongella sp. TaxID=2888820 RepID=UPI002F94C0C7
MSILRADGWNRRTAPNVWLSVAWNGLADRGLALVLLALTAGAVLGAAMLNAPAVVLLVVAAAPILVVVGARYGLVVLPVAIVVRALVDHLETVTITGGIAVGLIGLALLVTWRSPSGLLTVFTVTGYLVISAAAGATRFGATTTYIEALRLVSALAVALVVLNAPGKLTAVGIARTAQYVGIVPAIVAIEQFATGTGTYIDGLLRASGTLAQANSAGALFAICNVASFALLMTRAPRRTLNLALFVLFLGGQAATVSVGGAITCLVMVIVFLLTLRHARWERIALSLLGIALVLFLAVTSSPGRARLAEFTGAGANPLSKDNSLGWRIAAWKKVLDAWRQNPVFGNGVGATQANVILVGNIPHDEYVRLLAETGVFGLGLVLAGCAFYGLRMAGTVGSSADFAPSLALAVLAGTLVNAIAANTMLYSVSFYLTLFILAGCWRITHPRQAPRSAGTTRAAPALPAPRARPAPRAVS